MPEKVPLWVVENTFNTFGSRFPKRPDTILGDLHECATCKRDLPTYQDWNYSEEAYYCNACIIPIRTAQQERWKIERERHATDWRRDDWRGGRNYRPDPTINIEAIPRIEADVPSGNLEQSQYQYWIGDLEEVSAMRGVYTSRATCRACGEVVHGSMGRAVHKQQSTMYYKNKDNCMKVISLAIKDLVHLHNCFVCKVITSKKHYGVPICSPACHKVWRFEVRIYPELEFALLPYWAGDGRKQVITTVEEDYSE